MDGWMKDERQHFFLRPPRGLESAYQHSCVVTNLVEMCHLLGENFFSWLHGYEHTFLPVSAPGVLSRLDQLTWRQITWTCNVPHSVFLSQSQAGHVRTWHTLPQVRDSNIQIPITTASWELLYSNHSTTAFLCHKDTHKAERVMPSWPHCTYRAWDDISYCCLLLTIYRDKCI